MAESLLYNTLVRQRSKLGLSTVTVMQGNHPLAIVDKTLVG